MIRKEELLEHLRQNQDIEEKAIPIYKQHLNDTLFLSGFSEEAQKKIAEVLEILETDTEIHRKMFEGMIKKIEASEKHVY